MTATRKDAHVRLALAQHDDGPHRPGPLDDVEFVHHALAGIDRDRVSLRTSFAGVEWPAPLYINAMTGGSERTGQINRDLAIAARENDLPIATGSMSPYLKDPGTASTFAVVRGEHPTGFVMANLNASAGPEQARRAVSLLQADALQIHLNAVQETVMPEGDRAFGAWSAGVERIAAAVDVPVFVKEVGFGLSGRTVGRLGELGVRAADVGGRGGTNFARIENGRRARADYSYLDDWGLTTPACLLDARDGALPLLASGGIRHPLDAVRCLALGAKAIGVSGEFLSVLHKDGVTALSELIRSWLDQLAALMALLGAPTPAALADCDVLVVGGLREFCTARGIDLSPGSTGPVPTTCTEGNPK